MLEEEEEKKKEKTWHFWEDMTRQPLWSNIDPGSLLHPPPPHSTTLIEGVSVTLLIGYSSVLSWTRSVSSNLLIAFLAELSRFVLC